MWDAETGDNYHTFSGHTQPVKCLAWSPDDCTLVSGSDDGTVRCWQNMRAPKEDRFQEGEETTGTCAKIHMHDDDDDALCTIESSHDNIIPVPRHALGLSEADEETSLPGVLGWHSALTSLHKK